MTRWKNFAEAYIPEPNSGCWLWIGAITNLGYGNIRNPITRKVMPAHRAAYLMAYGNLPDNLDILHRCDVRCCVNPDHLFVGTHADNMLDMARKGRAQRVHGQAHHAAKVTSEVVRDIRASTELHAVLAARYGISIHTVHTIRDGRTWKHVPQIGPGAIDKDSLP